VEEARQHAHGEEETGPTSWARSAKSPRSVMRRDCDLTA
jgi:hypothetical protein